MNATTCKNTPISLASMPDGSLLTVAELAGTAADRSRLYALGILPGTTLEVCRRCCEKGSVRVKVRQCSLVLGDSVANNIFCHALENKDPAFAV